MHPTITTMTTTTNTTEPADEPTDPRLTARFPGVPQPTGPTAPEPSPF